MLAHVGEVLLSDRPRICHLKPWRYCLDLLERCRGNVRDGAQRRSVVHGVPSFAVLVVLDLLVVGSNDQTGDLSAGAAFPTGCMVERDAESLCPHVRLGTRGDFVPLGKRSGIQALRYIPAPCFGIPTRPEGFGLVLFTEKEG